MKKIGFKNFRRFQNFEPMEFKGITFLVGKNNAGKSTVVKAILLVLNYLKSNEFGKFSFDNNVLEDANIVTYGRALNSTSIKNKIDFITYQLQYEHIVVEITISGQHDRSFADVINLNIYTHDNVTFKFNMPTRTLIIQKEALLFSEPESNEGINRMINEQGEIRRQIKEYNQDKTKKEYIDLLSQFDRIKTNINQLKKSLDSYNSGKSIEFTIEGEFGNNISLTGIVDNVIASNFKKYEIEFEKTQQGIKPNPNFHNLRALKLFDPDRLKSNFEFYEYWVNDLLLMYIGSCSQKQSALLSIRDTKNILAQSIHEYYQLIISPGEEEHLFIIKWMKEFEVGDDFEIEFHSGEAYQFYIKSEGSRYQLSDMGMGSIQIMSIILRLACSIKKTKILVYENGSYISDDKILDYGPTIEKRRILILIMVEEPELNLHPALQSKLAYLFHEVYVNFNISLLIETHSEYLIRNTQLIVKESEYEVSPNVNPFCVIYFDQESKKWEMNYRADGKFIEEFGSGFFNETRNIIKQMM